MGGRFNPEDYRVRYETVGEWTLRVTSYKLGEKFVCSADNTASQDTPTWKEGASREEAEAKALEQVRRSIQAMQKFG